MLDFRYMVEYDLITENCILTIAKPFMRIEVPKLSDLTGLLAEFGFTNDSDVNVVNTLRESETPG